MKAWIIAMPDEQSQALAQRCAASARSFGLDPELFPAIHGEEAAGYFDDHDRATRGNDLHRGANRASQPGLRIYLRPGLRRVSS